MSLLSWIQSLTHTPIADEHNPEEDQPLSPGLAKRLEELKRIKVKDAMIPRPLILALDADVQLRRVRRLKSSKSLYFPVYKGDLDHILGWISKQKVLELLNEPAEEVQLAQHLRPVAVVCEDQSVAELADVFLSSGGPFLTVVNGHGSTTGIMQLSEFVELIFGFELEPNAPNAQAELSPPLLRGYEL